MLLVYIGLGIVGLNVAIVALAEAGVRFEEWRDTRRQDREFCQRIGVRL